MSAEVIDRLGWYGKLPAIGDFASRRLPAAFIEPWDAWLQASLAQSQTMLGARWLDAYLRAPIRRFALGEAVLAGGPWSGLLMPSVDRVGRHFPLTIAFNGDGCDESLDRAEAAALATLDLAAKLEDFDRALQAIAITGTPSARTAAGRSRWWCVEAGAASDELEFPGLPPPASFVALLGA